MSWHCHIVPIRIESHHVANALCYLSSGTGQVGEPCEGGREEISQLCHHLVWCLGQCHRLVLSDSSKRDMRIIIEAEVSDRVKKKESVIRSGRRG